MEGGAVEIHPAARCRLCAAHEAIKVDIFGDEGRSRKLVEKIQTCLPIKVGMEDRLPKSLCFTCMYLLEKLFEFRQCCLKANETLEEYVEEYEARAAVTTSTPAGRLQSLEEQLCSMKMEVQHDVMPTLEVQIPRSASTSRSNSTSGSPEPSPSPQAVDPATSCSDSLDVIDLDGPLEKTPPVDDRNKHVVARKSTSVDKPQSRTGAATRNLPTKEASSNDDDDVVDLTDDRPRGDGDQSRPSTSRGKANRRPTAGTSSLLKETLIRNEGRSRKRSSSVEIEEVAVTSKRVSVASAKAVENVVNALNARREQNGVADEEGGSSRRKSAKPRKIARTDEPEVCIVEAANKPFSCMLCAKSFTLKNALSRHFNACHGVEIADANHDKTRPKKTNYDQDIECIEVDDATRDATLLYCEICLRSFNDKSSLWLHLMYSHKDAAPFACGLCLKLFKDNVGLSRHWKAHYAEDSSRNEYLNMERRYSCEICGRQDNSRKKLTNHMKIHVFDNSFDPEMLIIVNADYYNAEKRKFDFTDFADVSQDAASSFTSSMYVGEDYATGTYLPCEQCYKAFETEEALAKHRRTVHKVYVDCQVCGETFDTEEKLMAHVTAEHFDGNHMLAEQPSYNPFEPVVDLSNHEAFYCRYCSQQFASMKEVEKHQRGCKSATGRGKPPDVFSHHCELCKKSFVSEDCLVKHKKGAHKTESSQTDADVSYNSFYFCEFCGSSHETKVDRWRHVNASHSDETSIRCDQATCGKIFAAESLCVEHRAHHDAQGAYPNTCELCGKLWHSRVEYWKHIQGVHAEMLPFVCGVCLKMFGETATLVAHVRASHRLAKGGHHCAVCARQYSNQSKCARHEAIHGDALPKRETEASKKPAVEKAVILKTPAVAKKPAAGKVATSKDESLLWCDLCPQIANFATIYDLANHRRAEHSLHPCDLCTKFYGRNSHLWKHVNKKHRGNPEIMCNICLKVSATKTQLTVHFKKIHKVDYAVDTPQPTVQEVECAEANSHILTIPSFQASANPSAKSYKEYVTYDCHVCKKKFIKRYMLKKHLSFCLKRARRATKQSLGPTNAGGGTVHACEICGAEFDCRSRLGDHHRSQHKTSQCENCAESFPTRAGLLDHVRGAHPELRCAACDRFALSPEDLATHAAQHATHDFPPYCELCGEVLPSRVRIWHHFNAYHKDDIPHLCGVCYRRVGDTEALKAHVGAEHPGATDAEKTCKVCAKGYSSVYKVLDHVNKYHAGYVGCKECLHVFGSQKELKRHAGEVHGSDVEPEGKSAEVSTPAPVVEKVAAVAKVTKAKAAEVELSPMQRAKRSYSCDKCPVTFGKPSELNAHKRRKHLSNTPPLVSIPGNSEVLIKDEVIDEVGEDFATSEPFACGGRTSDKRVPSAECRVCSETFPSVDELKSHHLEGCGSLKVRRRLLIVENDDDESRSESRTEAEEEEEDSRGVDFAEVSEESVGGSSGMPVLKPNKPIAMSRCGKAGDEKEMPDLETDDSCVLSDESADVPEDRVAKESVTAEGSRADPGGGSDCVKQSLSVGRSTESESDDPVVTSTGSEVNVTERSAIIKSTTDVEDSASDSAEVSERTSLQDSDGLSNEKSINSARDSGIAELPAAVVSSLPTNNKVGAVTLSDSGGSVEASVEGTAASADCLNSLEDALDILEAQNS